jgi:hypothetical protein
MGKVEKDFWAAADPASCRFNWKFPDSPDTLVFLSQAVHLDTEKVTYVSHEIDDGAWQFLGDSMAGGGKPVIACFYHLVDRDPSLSERSDLPRGWWAERANPDSPWMRHAKERDGDS